MTVELLCISLTKEDQLTVKSRSECEHEFEAAGRVAWLIIDVLGGTGEQRVVFLVLVDEWHRGMSKHEAADSGFA